MASPRHAFATFAAPDFTLIDADLRRFKAAGLAQRTVSSYASDERVFGAWCKAAKRVAFPATSETLQLYVADILRMGRKISTAKRHVTAIHRAHKVAGLLSPVDGELRAVLAGARRVLCQQPNQKEPLQVSDLKKIVRIVGTDTPIAARNCAAVVFGFATSLRRSNLAALNLEDLTFFREGVLVRVAHEKQDRKGKGRTLAVPNGKGTTCPVKLLNRWLQFRGRGPGSLFQGVMRGHCTGRAIKGNRLGQIVQDCAAAIGKDRKLYGAHSLRSGFVTSALERGVNESQICKQTGHASTDTLRIYFRPANLFRGNAAGKIGL